MGLADEARSLARRPGGWCSVGRLIAATPGLNAELAEALNDPSLDTAAIHRALRARGFKIGDVQTLGRHRRGECLCPV